MHMSRNTLFWWLMVGYAITTLFLIAPSVRSLRSGNDGQVVFYPTSLEIPETPKFVPIMTEFELINAFDAELTIHSIDTSSTWLKAVPPSKAIVSPGTLLKLTVVATPLSIGDLNSKVVVRTSLGTFEYPVHLSAIANPYRAVEYELQGTRGNLYQNQQPPEFAISIYNPHDSILQVLDTFTTAKFMSVAYSLSPTTADDDGEESSTADVATRYSLVSLNAKEETTVFRCIVNPEVDAGIYKSFVSIKTDFDNILIPVELRLAPEKFRFTEKSLDFGIFTSRGDNRTLDVVVEYIGQSPLVILEVTIEQPSPSVEILLLQHMQKLGPNRTMLASVAFKALRSGDFTGTIIVKSTTPPNKFIDEQHIQYYAKVMFENRIVDVKNTTFYLQPRRGPKDWREYGNYLPKSRHELVISNYGRTAMKVESIQMNNCHQIFRASFRRRRISPYVRLEVVRDIDVEDIGIVPRTCWLEIATNVSVYKVPIHIANARVELDAISGDLLSHTLSQNPNGPDDLKFADFYDVDIGDILPEMPPDVKFVLSNYNPSEQRLVSINASVDTCACMMAFVPIGEGSLERCQDEIRALQVEDFAFISDTGSSRCLCSTNSFGQTLELRPGFHTIFSVITRRFQPMQKHDRFFTNRSLSSNDGTMSSYFALVSDHQSLSFRINYRRIAGTVDMRCLYHNQCGTFYLGLAHTLVDLTVSKSLLVPSVGDGALVPTLPHEMISYDTITPQIQVEPIRYHVEDGSAGRTTILQRVSPTLKHRRDNSLLANSLWYPAIQLAKESRYQTDAAWERLQRIESLCLQEDGSVQYDRLYDELTAVRDMVMPWYRDGLYMPRSGLIVSNAAFSKTFLFSRPSAYLPMQEMPRSYHMEVVTGWNRITTVYLDYTNLFLEPVTVRMMSAQMRLGLKFFPVPHNEHPSQMNYNDYYLSPIYATAPNGERVLSSEHPLSILKAASLRAVSDHSIHAHRLVPLANQKGGQENSNLSALIRFPNLEWVVGQQERVLIGPIELITSAVEATTTFKTVIYNSFSGFDHLEIVVNNSRPKIVVQQLLQCHLRSQHQQKQSDGSCKWVPVSLTATAAAATTAVALSSSPNVDGSPRRWTVPFTHGDEHYLYRLRLRNEGSLAVINQVKLGKFDCHGSFDIIQASVLDALQRQLIQNICRQLPLKLQQDQGLEFDFYLPELSLYQSYPLIVSFHEVFTPEMRFETYHDEFNFILTNPSETAPINFGAITSPLNATHAENQTDSVKTSHDNMGVKLLTILQRLSFSSWPTLSAAEIEVLTCVSLVALGVLVVLLTLRDVLIAVVVVVLPSIRIKSSSSPPSADVKTSEIQLISSFFAPPRHRLAGQKDSGNKTTKRVTIDAAIAPPVESKPLLARLQQQTVAMTEKQRAAVEQQRQQQLEQQKLHEVAPSSLKSVSKHSSTADVKDSASTSPQPDNILPLVHKNGSTGTTKKAEESKSKTSQAPQQSSAAVATKPPKSVAKNAKKETLSIEVTLDEPLSIVVPQEERSLQQESPATKVDDINHSAQPSPLAANQRRRMETQGQQTQQQVSSPKDLVQPEYPSPVEKISVDEKKTPTSSERAAKSINTASSTKESKKSKAQLKKEAAALKEQKPHQPPAVTIVSITSGPPTPTNPAVPTTTPATSATASSVTLPSPNKRRDKGESSRQSSSKISGSAAPSPSKSAVLTQSATATLTVEEDKQSDAPVTSQAAAKPSAAPATTSTPAAIPTENAKVASTKQSKEVKATKGDATKDKAKASAVPVSAQTFAVALTVQAEKNIAEKESEPVSMDIEVPPLKTAATAALVPDNSLPSPMTTQPSQVGPGASIIRPPPGLIPRANASLATTLIHQNEASSRDILSPFGDSPVFEYHGQLLSTDDTDESQGRTPEGPHLTHLTQKMAAPFLTQPTAAARTADPLLSFAIGSPGASASPAESQQQQPRLLARTPGHQITNVSTTTANTFNDLHILGPSSSSGLHKDDDFLSYPLWDDTFIGQPATTNQQSQLHTLDHNEELNLDFDFERGLDIFASRPSNAFTLDLGLSSHGLTSNTASLLHSSSLGSSGLGFPSGNSDFLFDLSDSMTSNHPHGGQISNAVHHQYPSQDQLSHLSQQLPSSSTLSHRGSTATTLSSSPSQLHGVAFAPGSYSAKDNNGDGSFGRSSVATSPHDAHLLKAQLWQGMNKLPHHIQQQHMAFHQQQTSQQQYTGTHGYLTQQQWQQQQQQLHQQLQQPSPTYTREAPPTMTVPTHTQPPAPGLSNLRSQLQQQHSNNSSGNSGRWERGLLPGAANQSSTAATPSVASSTSSAGGTSSTNANTGGTTHAYGQSHYAPNQVLRTSYAALSSASTATSSSTSTTTSASTTNHSRYGMPPPPPPHLQVHNTNNNSSNSSSGNHHTAQSHRTGQPSVTTSSSATTSSTTGSATTSESTKFFGRGRFFDLKGSGHDAELEK